LGALELRVQAKQGLRLVEELRFDDHAEFRAGRLGGRGGEGGLPEPVGNLVVCLARPDHDPFCHTRYSISCNSA
jgi:hypothetical protein